MRRVVHPAAAYGWMSVGLSVLVALSVIAGWLTGNMGLVRWQPGIVPMQFNTALCFLPASAGIGLLYSRYRQLAWVAGMGGALFAGIMGLEYIIGVKYGIGGIFLHPDSNVHFGQSGRMAPNGIAAFIILGLGIALCSMQAAREEQKIIFTAMLCGSLVMALGIVPLLGYMSGVEQAYGWQNFTRMAIQTALCFTLLGSALVVHCWVRAEGQPAWLPLPLGIGLVLIVVATAQALREQEYAQTHRLLKVEAKHLAEETARKMNELNRALKRITWRWEAAGGTPEALWRKDARAYLEGYPFLDALAYVNNTGKMQWIESRDARIKPALLEGAAGLVELPEGKGWQLIHPLKSSGRLVAIIHLNRLFDEIRLLSGSGPVQLFVRQEKSGIYGHVSQGSPWIETAAVKGEGMPGWTLFVNPTEEILRQSITRMPWVVLCAGLFSVSLMVFSLFLLLRLRVDGLVLKEKKQRLRAVIQQAADGIILINQTGGIEEFNPACEALFGYPAEEMIGKNVKLLMPDPDHSRHDSYLRHYNETGEKRIIGAGREVQGRRKNGSLFDIDLRVSEVILPRRKIFMGMIRDVTERKAAEERLHHLMDKLTESNNELERFAYVASHDLREPLRLVANFASLLKKDYFSQLDETAQEYIDVINEAASRMHFMVGDLLEYARIGNEELRYSRVSMEKEMQHVYENLLSFIAEHKAELTWGELPDVKGNPVQLMRLLQNLVANAIKFHARGNLPVVQVNAEEKEDHWQFIVRDNGIGFEPEYAQQIFEPFRKLHARNEYKGTGIGLAICKRIVEKHGGEIRAQSQRGEGSIFYFTLPK